MSVPDGKGPPFSDKSIPRLAQVVIRSKPSSERPRLSTESENRLEEIEAEKAACYATMENTAAEFQALTEQLRKARITRENLQHAVPDGVVEESVRDSGSK